MRLALIVSRAITREPIAACTGHVEELARDLLAQAVDERAPARVGAVAVDDQAERVDRLAGEEDVDPDELARLEAEHVVVEAGIALRPALQLVVVVVDDLREREVEDEEHALLAQILQVVEAAAALVVQLHDGADVLLGHDRRRPDVRLLDGLDLAAASRPGCAPRPPRLPSEHAVGDVRRRHEQVEVELALEPLAHDLHVQEAEEAAAEPEAERLRRLGLVEERGVVQLQLLERVAQGRVLVGVGREEPGEDRRLHVLVAGERLSRRPALRR